MQIKAIVIDFDGTIVTEDILAVLSDLVGKRKECEEINSEIKYCTPLCRGDR